MGASKELFMDIRYRVELDEEQLKQIPKEVRDGLTFTRIEAVNFKDEYKKCPTWVALNNELKEVIQKREEVETQIRIDKRLGI